MRNEKPLTGHHKDPDYDGKICQEATHPLRKETSGFELLQAVGNDENSKEENDGHKEDVVTMSTAVPNHFSTSLARTEEK